MILILSAMPEELEAIVASIDQPRPTHSAGRHHLIGQIAGQDVLAAFSRWGKVAAASTTSHLLTAYKPTAVVFTGIAGALRTDLDVGDLVLAEALVQHDLDARPFFPRTQVPLLGLDAIATDRRLTDELHRTLTASLAGKAARARLWRGVVATGDQVIGSSTDRMRVLEAAPSALCVEMEGAAVAQVCHDFGVPFACLRMISDRADESLAPAEIFELARRSGEQAAAMLRAWLGSAQ